MGRRNIAEKQDRWRQEGPRDELVQAFQSFYGHYSNLRDLELSPEAKARAFATMDRNVKEIQELLSMIPSDSWEEAVRRCKEG